MLLINGGAPLPAVQRYLGHKSLQSTSAYLKVDDASASAFAQNILGAKELY